MSTNPFHPSLVSAGVITEKHHEYIEWARAYYTDINKVPSIGKGLTITQCASGDAMSWYSVEPIYPLSQPSETLLVRRHPFGNKNRPHMHIWAQIISDVTGSRVMSFPTNIGIQRPEKLARSTKKILDS